MPKVTVGSPGITAMSGVMGKQGQLVVIPVKQVGQLGVELDLVILGIFQNIQP